MSAFFLIWSFLFSWSRQFSCTSKWQLSWWLFPLFPH